LLDAEGEFSTIVNMVEDDNFSITTFRTHKGKFYHVLRSFYLDPKTKKWKRSSLSILDRDLESVLCLWRKACLFPYNSLKSGSYEKKKV